VTPVNFGGVAECPTTESGPADPGGVASLLLGFMMSSLWPYQNDQDYRWLSANTQDTSKSIINFLYDTYSASLDVSLDPVYSTSERFNQCVPQIWEITEITDIDNCVFVSSVRRVPKFQGNIRPPSSAPNSSTRLHGVITQRNSPP
jgi:hypothetical protein